MRNHIPPSVDGRVMQSPGRIKPSHRSGTAIGRMSVLSGLNLTLGIIFEALESLPSPHIEMIIDLLIDVLNTRGGDSDIEPDSDDEADADDEEDPDREADPDDEPDPDVGPIPRAPRTSGCYRAAEK